MTVDNFKEEDSGYESGFISIYSGSLSNIPTGWAICDGNNNTPDLRDKFLKGATSSSNIGTTGGQKTHSLSTSQISSHSHGGSSDSGGSTHKHTMGTEPNAETNGDGTQRNFMSSYDYGNDIGYSTTTGDHSHNISVGSTGNGDSIDNIPQNYEVAYIMRL